MYAPAIQSYDWTVLTLDEQPVKVYRGVDGDPNAVTSLLTGYEPVLLNRTNINGQKLLAPYNLTTASRIVAMSFCEPRSWTRVLSS